MDVFRSGPVDYNAALMARRRAAEDRYRVGQAIGQTGVALALLWWIHIIRHIGDLDWRWAAIDPGVTAGLVGVLTGPLIHGSFGHLISNTVPMWILGSMARYAYPRALWFALPTIWLCSGLGTWLFGRPSLHLGASGVAHGLMFFLFVIGLLRRDRLAIVVALITFFLYGSMIWTIFPQEPGVSWEAHLFGAIGGVISALLWRKRDAIAPRAPYSWEIDPEEDEEPRWREDEPIIDTDADPNRTRIGHTIH
jgi:membrane associated rhomboid family serine protease